MKRLVVVLLAFLLLASIAGCAATTGTETSAAAVNEPAAETSDTPEVTTSEVAEQTSDLIPVEDQLYIFVDCLTGIEYIQDHKLGFEVACARLGVQGEFVGPADADVAQQAAAFEQAIAKNPQGIITMAIDESMIPIMNKAVEAGIPVVCVDNDYPTSERQLICGTGNVNAGEVGGAYAAEVLGGAGKVAVITNTGSTNLAQRLEGYQNVFADFPGIEIVAYGESGSDTLISANNAASLIQAYPELDAFICLDAVGGAGAATAVSEAGKVGEIKIFAMDKDTTTLQYILDGVITFTVAQNTSLMPYYATVALFSNYNDAAALGVDPATGVIAMPVSVDTGCFIIDASNAQAFLDAKAN